MKRKLLIAATLIFALFVLISINNPFLLFFLSGKYEGMGGTLPFSESHERAVKSFVASEGFGVARIKRKGFWNGHTIEFEDKRYTTNLVRLIGLTPEKGRRYFDQFRPPKKTSMQNAEWRELTQDESTSIDRILSGESKLEELKDSNNEGGRRLIAPIAAQAECLGCHDVDVGDILGAFDYHLWLIPDYPRKSVDLNKRERMVPELELHDQNHQTFRLSKSVPQLP